MEFLLFISIFSVKMEGGTQLRGEICIHCKRNIGDHCLEKIYTENKMQSVWKETVLFLVIRRYTLL